MTLPMLILAALSLIAGFLDVPRNLGNLPIFPHFLESALPAAATNASREGLEGIFQVLSGGVSLGGIFLIYLLIRQTPRLTAKLVQSPVGGALHRWWFAGWGFDRLYDETLVHPYVRLSRVNRNDVIDLPYRGIAWLNFLCWHWLSTTQTGRTRSCALGIALGAAVILGLVVLL